MSNVWDQHRRQQIAALGRPGWSLRRIEETTGVRRETVSGCLKAAGIPVRARGGWRASSNGRGVMTGTAASTTRMPCRAVAMTLSGAG
jgi:hypothetical protein